MPSKDPTVKRQTDTRHRNSAKSKSRTAVWNNSVRGKASRAKSGKKWKQSPAGRIALSKRNKARKAKRKAWFSALKSELSCCKCGFDKHPSALQFHHVGNKVDGITRMVGKTSVSVDLILLEIGKCIVLCANCHAILHAEEVRPGEL